MSVRLPVKIDRFLELPYRRRLLVFYTAPAMAYNLLSRRRRVAACYLTGDGYYRLLRRQRRFAAIYLAGDDLPLITLAATI